MWGRPGRVERLGWETRELNARGLVVNIEGGRLSGLESHHTGRGTAAERRLAQHGLNIDDRCAVDDLNGPNQETLIFDLANRDLMETDRIWTVRGSCREDAGQRIVLLSSWVNFQRVAAGLVQPCQHDDLVTGF